MINPLINLPLVPKVYAQDNPNFYAINQQIGLSGEFTQPLAIISRLLPYLLIIAGLILLFVIASAGFQIMTAGQNSDKAQAARQRLTTAIAGFFVIFAAYWIGQLIEVIFGVNILGN